MWSRIDWRLLDQNPPPRRARPDIRARNNFSSDGSVYSSSRDHELHDNQNSPGGSVTSNPDSLQPTFVRVMHSRHRPSAASHQDMSTFQFDSAPVDASFTNRTRKAQGASHEVPFEKPPTPIEYPDQHTLATDSDSNTTNYRDKSLGLAQDRFAELYGLTSDMEPILMVCYSFLPERHVLTRSAASSI